MTWISKALTFFGSLLLAHACYSAHEFSSLSASRFSQSSRSPQSLPLDITAETLVSAFIICLGLVLGAEKLKPISWRVWAGNIEREAREGKQDENTKLDGRGGNPFAGLEHRLGFVDIRAQRKEFANWVRETGGVAKN
ncbi:MAG: hypothetical protein M1834_008126 [Cirrosporium novae-zelandiae]|nr:MAG: hypothetical protein M1834_008126 [Cirrosporium novae-zelandiae]